jgi:hypothetical protein
MKDVTDTLDNLMRTTLDVLKLNIRARNALAGAGITTLSDLTARSVGDLQRTKNIGPVMIRELAEALHRHGLYLRGSEPPNRLVPAQYTVVVAQSHKTAQIPNHPVMAYVLPTGNLPPSAYQEFREAAEKGGCAVSMFTVGDSGIEHVKFELLHFSSTRLM